MKNSKKLLVVAWIITLLSAAGILASQSKSEDTASYQTFDLDNVELAGGGNTTSPDTMAC